MFYIKRNLTIVVMLFAVAVMSGCGSGAKKKAAMVARWEQSTAFAKLPMAEELAVNGRYEEAMAIVDKCISADPKSFEGHFSRGKVFLMEGMSAEAKESFTSAQKCEGPTEAAWFMLGVIAEQEGSVEKAFEYYSKAMELKPSRSGYVIALAELKADMEDYEDAVALLRKKSEAFYAGSELKVALAEMLVRHGEVDEAIGVYNRLLVSDGDQSEYLVPLGYCYVINKDWAGGVRVFSRLVEKTDGQQRDAHLEMLGICSMNNADYVQAMKCYDRLSIKRRGDADVWLRMGQAAFGANIPKRALVCAKKAYALRPGSSNAMMLKGCAEYIQGDYAKAFESFDWLASKSESSSFIEMMMSRCNERIEKNL